MLCVRRNSPFQAAFEGLHHELGGRASSFPSSSPPPLLTPQPRHAQHLYSSASPGSMGATRDASPTPPVATGQRSKSKICGVCGDRAKSYHFGGISCDSCKGVRPLPQGQLCDRWSSTQPSFDVRCRTTPTRTSIVRTRVSVTSTSPPGNAANTAGESSLIEAERASARKGLQLRM